MKRDLRDYITDMASAASDIEKFVGDMDFEEFISDKKTANAVIRSLEVIGEAAKMIPEDVRKKHHEIPWKRMAGMRDKLIHEYSGVDLEIVWKVVKEELPPIKPSIDGLLGHME